MQLNSINFSVLSTQAHLSTGFFMSGIKHIKIFCSAPKLKNKILPFLKDLWWKCIHEIFTSNIEFINIFMVHDATYIPV